MYTGMKRLTRKSCRPIMLLRANSSTPETWEAMMTGMPMPPKATGAVFASRQMPAA